MLNLLPDEAQRQLRKEYRRRFIVLSLLFLSFAVVIGSIALLPYAFSYGFDYLHYRNETPVEAPKPSEEDMQATSVLQDFQDILSVLDPKNIKGTTTTPFSELLRLVISEKPPEVLLSSFSLTVESKTRGRFVISGLARERESLVAFSKNLSEHKLFSSVDLPISNLSRKEDIDFSITLTIGK